MKFGSEVHVMHAGRRRAGTVAKIPGYRLPPGTIAVNWAKEDRPEPLEHRTIVAKSKIVGER